MKLFIVNPSADSKSYVTGLVAATANTTIEVDPSNFFNLYNDQNFITDIKFNNLFISDGVTIFKTVEDSQNYLDKLMDINYYSKDIDGAQIVRIKAAKKGWSYWAIPIEITTSTLGASLFLQDSTGTNIPWVTAKIYDADNNEITTAGVLNANLNQCVKTVIDFEPTFDFEIIGGSLRINSNPTQDVRLWIVGAPDIPAPLGSKEFASGINLKFLSADSPLEIDGRVTKTLTYNPVTHQGKMRIMLKHPAGTQVNMQITVQIYRL
jgi:hypothetical protein